MLRAHGAHIIEADSLGRELMEPGHAVFDQIVSAFGEAILNPEGRIDRARLARIAFEGNRLQGLNAIVHPAVIALQQQLMEQLFSRDPKAVAIVESALIFEVVRDARARGEIDTVLSDWRRRIDRVIVVTAPDRLKTARYVDRLKVPPEKRPSAANDARSRLAHQIPDAEKASQADYVLDNSGDLASLQHKVDELWPRLKADSNNSPTSLSLK